MKLNTAIVLSALCIFSILSRSDTARILAILPVPSYSHQIPFRPLWIELLKRGHELVLVTPSPMDNVNSTNFKQIDIGSAYAEFKKISFVQMRMNKISWVSFVKHNIKPLTSVYIHHTLSNTEVRKLYAPDSKEKFDVVLIEMFYAHAIFPLAHKFGAPIIGLASFPLVTTEIFQLGGLILPSHDSTWEMETDVGTNLSFWKRLTNFLTLWHFIYVTHRELSAFHQELAETYFGKPLPSVIDMVKNTSIIFVNEAPVITYARPELPNVIKFHSLHVSQQLDPLQQDLKKFVDDAEDGFIYLSLGTNARFLDIPREIQDTFYDVLASLPYKIVWKTEKELPRKFDNVYTAAWFPQQSLLAHPNVKLFVYQGGLQSTQEAIHFTVPVLGIPILSDQEFQLKKLISLGVGLRLHLHTLTRESLDFSIRHLINDKTYKENMIKLRELVNDTPYDLVKNLAWWTEYVIRNRGAPHLRSNTVCEPWYRYYDHDIVAFLAIAVFIIVSVASVVSAKCLLFLYWRCRKQTATSYEKKTS